MNKNSPSAGVACAQLILIGVVSFGAFLSGVFWFTFLEGQSDLIRWGAVSGSVVFSFAGAACAYLAPSRSKALYAAAFVFMGADCAQNAMGYQSLGQLANGITQKQAAYDTAQAALMALPTPDAQGAIRQMSTYEQTRSALLDNVAMTEASLKSAKVTKFEDKHVLAVFALLQIALLLAFRGLGKAPRTEPVPVAQQAPVARQKPELHIVRTPVMNEQDQKAWKKIAKA